MNFEVLEKYKGLIISVSILILCILLSILLWNIFSGYDRKKIADYSGRVYTRAYVEVEPELDFIEFEYPPGDEKIDTPGVYFHRPMLKQWDEEQVKKYWIPMETILIEMLEEDNTRALEDIFKGVE